MKTRRFYINIAIEVNVGKDKLDNSDIVQAVNRFLHEEMNPSKTNSGNFSIQKERITSILDEKGNNILQ